MSTTSTHTGRNLKRLRELMGIKQEALALKLGDDWNQQKISLLEQKEQFDPKLLEEVAQALHVKPEAILNYDEDKAIYNIQHNYEGANPGSGNMGIFENCTINPVEKWLEALAENKRLYESLLHSEREKVELLKEQLGKKK